MLAECARRDFITSETSIEQPDGRSDPRTVVVALTGQGRGSVSDLAAAIADLEGVLALGSPRAYSPRFAPPAVGDN